MKKKRAGRPRSPHLERRSITRTFRVNPVENALLEKAAKRKGQPITHWMRESLLRVAQRIAKGGR